MIDPEHLTASMRSATGCIALYLGVVVGCGALMAGLIPAAGG